MTLDIEILQFLHYNPSSSRSEIEAVLTNPPSSATLKRLIAEEVKQGHIEVFGRGPATRYRLTPQAHVTMELNLDTYFDKDIDVMFYEQNNIAAFKRIFIEQFLFAVKTYF
jgi:hypothetical protein